MPRGGAREGSGRPRKYNEPTETVGFTLPVNLVEAIRQRAEDEEKTQSEVVAKLLARSLKIAIRPK